jgi:hypothetical protein
LALPTRTARLRENHAEIGGTHGWRQCRKFAMKNFALREFYTIKIFGVRFFFNRLINRLSIAQVR